MKLIDRPWNELSNQEKEYPARPDEVFVCRGCQPGWPPYFVARVKGQKNPVDLAHLGLFWEWDYAVAFAKIADSDKICKGCGRDLKPAPFEHAPGKFSYPDYPEFRGCR